MLFDLYILRFIYSLGPISILKSHHRELYEETRSLFHDSDRFCSVCDTNIFAPKRTQMSYMSKMVLTESTSVVFFGSIFFLGLVRASICICGLNGRVLLISCCIRLVHLDYYSYFRVFFFWYYLSWSYRGYLAQ